MGARIVLSPVGFEVQRVIEGIKEQGCNVVCLMQSRIPPKTSYMSDKRYDLHDKLVQISKDFIEKIEAQLSASRTYRIEKENCSFINYKECVRDICSVIEKIKEKYAKSGNIEGIWIDVGSATPLFATAATYIASFNPDLIHVFYTSASHYTINEVFKPRTLKEDILHMYEQNGLTFPDEGNGYNIVPIPVVPTERLHVDAIAIVLSIKKGLKTDFSQDAVSQSKILVDIDKEFKMDLKTEKKRAIKMKYRRQFIVLLEKHVIVVVASKGKDRIYKLTEAGIVYSIVLACFDVSRSTR